MLDDSSFGMNIAPGQNRLSRYGFTVQKRYEPLADGLVSAAEHSARLPADIQQATDAQARELEAAAGGGARGGAGGTSPRPAAVHQQGASGAPSRQMPHPRATF